MRRLCIIGNSGAARECYWLFHDMCKADAAVGREYAFHGFFSWCHYQAELKSLSAFFRGDAEEHEIQAGDVFAIGVGQPALRQDIYKSMKARGAEFFTLLHPLADINPTATVGEANIFQRNSTVFCDATLGNANYLNGAVNLSHDAAAGDCNFFGPFSMVLGNASVGSCNSMGVRCVVLPKARVGSHNILAPDCVVYKGCGDHCRLAGNPAVNIA